MTLPLRNEIEREIGCCQCWFSQKATILTAQKLSVGGRVNDPPLQ